MLNWISSNKEWLFSGIGVSLIPLSILLIKFFYSRKVEQFPFDDSIYKKVPYPSDIGDEIDKTPPLQQEAKQNSYQGLKVGWATTFETAHDSNVSGETRLMLLDRGNYPWVYCDVDINKYPEIKIAHRKTKVWVAGSIIEVSGGTIEIQVDDLKII